jgi:hypothetical protein
MCITACNAKCGVVDIQSDTVGSMEALFSSMNLTILKSGVPEARSCTVKEHTDIE